MVIHVDLLVLFLLITGHKYILHSRHLLDSVGYNFLLQNDAVFQAFFIFNFTEK